MTLYEIDKSIRDVIENGISIDEDTGEVMFMAEDLQGLELAKEKKLEGLALYIKETAAFADDIDAEIKTLTERKKAAQRKCESLKNYLAFILNGEKFETPKCSVTYRKSKRVELPEDINEVPEEYLKIKIDTVADKTLIKKAIDSGATVPGCRVIECVNMTVR